MGFTNKMQKYRKKLKENETKYQAHLKRERERDKKRRLEKSTLMDKASLAEKRKKDRERQRKYREAKRNVRKSSTETVTNSSQAQQKDKTRKIKIKLPNSSTTRKTSIVSQLPLEVEIVIKEEINEIKSTKEKELENVENFKLRNRDSSKQETTSTKDNLKRRKEADHHVHFDAASLKDDFESDSCVTYQRSGDTINVNLGFLQVNHRYTIDLKLPATLFGELGGGLSHSQFMPDITTVPNLHCRITEFSGLKHDEHDFYEMKIEFFAYKEKLLRETLHIVNSNNAKEVLKLMISARILGKGKGTPMLRNGIHCIGVERDEESEASDFPGFGKDT